MVFGFLILVILIAIFLLLFFPETLVPAPVVNVTEICISKCKAEVALGKNLSAGPCLLNPIPEAPDWVCDVAHWPREPVDNLPENQCSAFREGKATAFVEVNPQCEFIRATQAPTHIFLDIKGKAVYYFGRLVEAAKKLFSAILTTLG